MEKRKKKNPNKIRIKSRDTVETHWKLKASLRNIRNDDINKFNKLEEINNP